MVAKLVDSDPECAKCTSQPGNHGIFVDIRVKSEALCKALELKAASEDRPRKPD